MSKEILLVVDSVSLEKGVSKDVIFEAIESALAMATKKRYEEDEDAEFRVSIDRETGEYDSFRIWTVVEDLEEEEDPNPAAQIEIDEARERDPNLNIGDVIEHPVESVEFGRIAAQTAKQVIVQKVREAERAQGCRRISAARR